MGKKLRTTPTAPLRTVQCLGVGAIKRPHTFQTRDTTFTERKCKRCRDMETSVSPQRVYPVRLESWTE
jgi:hypothetical protein